MKQPIGAERCFVEIPARSDQPDGIPPGFRLPPAGNCPGVFHSCNLTGANRAPGCDFAVSQNRKFPFKGWQEMSTGFLVAPAFPRNMRLRPQMEHQLEKHSGSLAKALSWRLLGTLDTLLISWLITGSIRLAATIGVTEVLTKSLLYYFHERAWLIIPFGKLCN